MDDLDQFFALADKHRDRAHFFGPHGHLIPAAEERLGFRFPTSVKRFISVCGAGSIGPLEFYGLFRPDFDNSMEPDAVWTTLDLRAESGLPDSMLVVYFEGSTRYYVLDAAKSKADGEPPVEAWTPGVDDADSKLEVVFPDYGTMLRTMMEETFERS